MERENLCSDAKGEIASGSNREDQSTDAEHRDGAVRSRDERPCNGAGPKGLRCSAEATGQLKPSGNGRSPWTKQSRSMATAEHREPYESRGSRTVLERPEVKALRATRQSRHSNCAPVASGLPDKQTISEGSALRKSAGTRHHAGGSDDQGPNPMGDCIMDYLRTAGRRRAIVSMLESGASAREL